MNRTKVVRKSKTVALARGFNTLKNAPIFYPAPLKGVCTKVTTTPKET